MKTLVLGLLGLGLGWMAWAMPPPTEVDSLRRLTGGTAHDSVRVRAWHRLAEHHRNARQFDSARWSLDRAHELAQQARLPVLAAWTDYYRGHNELAAGQLEAARAYFQAALRQARRHRLTGLQANSSINLADTWVDLGQTDSARAYYEHTFQLARQAGNTRYAVAARVNEANLLESMGQSPQALRRYQQALDLLKQEATPDTTFLANVLMNMGALYGRLGDVAAASRSNRQARALLERCACNPGTLANLLYNEADDAPTSEAALAILNEARSLAQSVDDESLVLAIASAQVHHLLKLQRIEAAAQALAVARKQIGSHTPTQFQILYWHAEAAYAEAVGRFADMRRSATAAVAASQQVGHLENLQLSYQYLYRADSLLGDYRASLDHYQAYRRATDSLRSESKAREIGRLEAQHEAQQQRQVREVQLAAERSRSRWLLGSACAALLLISLLALTLLRSRNRERQTSTELRRLYHEVEFQRTEIEAMNAELRSTLDESQNQEKRLTEQHEKIEDSLRYASRIQQAILPAPRFLNTFLPPYFIHYQPRDIISGDFYWMARTESKTLFAAVDCTGHGVPGAFMSVMGHNLLNQIVSEMGIDRPATVLKSLDSRIVRMLGQDTEIDSMNGMDVCLVVLHDPDAEGTRIVEYAGAGRPLWVCAGGEIAEYRSARYPCGGGQHPNKAFPATRRELTRGSRLYLFSDGITDQFGGQPTSQGRYRKLGRPNLKRFLETTAHLPLPDQRAAFTDFFTGWMGQQKPLDDVLLACIEV